MPRYIVTDNGKEFHSEQLQAFCGIFSTQIIWRRASHARDSTRVENALGVVQLEVTNNLMGNSKALQNPRNVSSTHDPRNFTEWTLKALHGSLNHYFFTTLMERVNHAYGVAPREYEQQLNFKFGARAHRGVAYDDLFRLLSSPKPRRKLFRNVDSRLGVWADGTYHWHPTFALAKPSEKVEIRLEPFNARVIYVCFRNEWLMATARDDGILYGRFEEELEYQRRIERREAKAAAARDKVSIRHAKQRVASWKPELWDPLLREQCCEEYRVYEALNMVEALVEAKNPEASKLGLGAAKQASPAHATVVPVAQVQRLPSAVVEPFAPSVAEEDEDDFEEEF